MLAPPIALFNYEVLPVAMCLLEEFGHLEVTMCKPSATLSEYVTNVSFPCLMNKNSTASYILH
jgi:hypothetical protein